MRVELIKTYQFEAAHKTALKRGETTPVHGHSFEVEVVVEGECHPTYGWLIDYGDISKVMEPLYVQLDHRYLNEVAGLSDPSVNGVARWIKAELARYLPQLSDVRVHITGDGYFNPVVTTERNRDGFASRCAFTFEAAHYLPNLPTTHKCRHMHGHSFRVEIAGDAIESAHDRIHALYNATDHRCLNEIEGLENPTSEMVARFAWNFLVNGGYTPEAVIVAETCTARCIYRGQ